MKTKIAKLVIGCIYVIWLASVALAWDLAWFAVKVNPSTVKVGEPADLTIKALDSNWDVLTDYKGDIIITVTDQDGNELDVTDYTVPNDGTYEFTDEDQWVHTFTKWLIINKPGDFKVVVTDFDTWKTGSAPVKVVSSSAQITSNDVKIISPQNNEIITNSTLSVAWQAVNYKNSKLQVLIDWKVVAEWLVNSDGSFQVEVGWITNGDHTLQVQILDINNKVVAKSKKINFKAQIKNKLFKKIEILPSNEVSQWTKVTVNVTVDPSVNQAILHVTNYGDYPMDRSSTTMFTTKFVANTPWKFDISFTLNTADGKTKNYSNIAKLVVLEKIAVTDVKFVRDNNEKTIALNWKFTGQVPKFKVLYGTGGLDKLTNSAIVSENKFVLKNIDPALTYYVKIIPVDDAGNQIGDASKTIVIEPNLQKAATCQIDNIKVSVVRRNWANYLVWPSAWTGIVAYKIYQWSTPDNLELVASLKPSNKNQYKLPYDANAKKVKYAYFVVKAQCVDNSLKAIDKAKKVKVWPMDWLLYAIILTMIVYGLKLAIRES